jgi:hypothetical protein
MYTITNVIQTFNRSLAHTIQLHIYMAQFPLLPLLIPFCSPFVSPSTYLAPSSCDRNRPPPSQVACKLTLFAPPFTQLSHPFQIPPNCPAPNNDDLGNIPALAIRNNYCITHIIILTVFRIQVLTVYC